MDRARRRLVVWWERPFRAVETLNAALRAAGGDGVLHPGG